jgi:hypothetical protein
MFPLGKFSKSLFIAIKMLEQRSPQPPQSLRLDPQRALQSLDLDRVIDADLGHEMI